ncbi:MAG: arginine--tRNA ligase [Saprospiraceae bacterium]|nr:arginine--tRNA ligase [Saprospiraceae bacterium]
MQNYLDYLYNELIIIFKNKFNHLVSESEVVLTPCKKEFEGDFTLILFPWLKIFNKSPDEIGEEIGSSLIQSGSITSFNLIKGFLNLTLPDSFWHNNFQKLIESNLESRICIAQPEKFLIEYCSPNTNKPLHLGHIRNILIGWSVYRILKAIGHTVNTTQVINDRGIAICKSMLAWKLFAKGATPESTSTKGDHFVGNFYVLFEEKFKEEYKAWQSSVEGEFIFKELKKIDESESDFFKRYKNEYFNKDSQLGRLSKELLLKWESNDEETRILWNTMNQWVYKGFDATFQKLKVNFDSYYFESQTYLLGKDIIQDGLNHDVFIKDSDGSVWIDLTDIGLDRKIVLRSDGTSVYITQDLGTIAERHKRYQADHYIYVVADEQDYHFKVLTETLKKLKLQYSNGIHHLNYGMVELPTGRMKSREGTVVDADDLIQEVIQAASVNAQERGELSMLTIDERDKVIFDIGMSALKYFILKVQAKKKMIFNPEDSVDMQGHTGPYIVNAFVRIKSIIRKFNSSIVKNNSAEVNNSEKQLLLSCMEYSKILQDSGKQLDPSLLANYLYQLAKDFHKYYSEYRILNAESDSLINWRINISKLVGDHLEHGMYCLGIEMPSRM